MDNIQLSKDFYLKEFTTSSTATRLGIDNTPNQAVIRNLEALCKNILQPLRDKVGAVINVTSGYRSPELNKQVGGKPTSQHLTGMAADIECHKLGNGMLFEIIKNMNLPYDQLIWEFGDEHNPDWVHVSFNPTGKNRKQIIYL